MVFSLQVVLLTGEIIRTLPTPNHATGPGLLQLFVGSEGTLRITDAPCGPIHSGRTPVDPLFSTSASPGCVPDHDRPFAPNGHSL
jgi:hypothetical protein